MGRLQVKTKYLNRFTDRKGVERIYFRVPGRKAVALPGPWKSDEMMSAYYREVERAKGEIKKTAGEEGTFRRLLADYYASPTFRRNAAKTQSTTRAILERFAVEHGHRMVAEMTMSDAEKIIGSMADRPGAANSLRKRLRALLSYAVRHGWRKDNPASGVAKFKEGTWHTWTDAEIAQFERRWPLGSRQRTAFALALYTGQRRSDIAAMTWNNYDKKARTIEVAQEKGEMDRHDEKLVIRVHPSLKATLDAWPNRHPIIIATGPNRGTSSNGLGNLMTDAIRAAGLPPRCVYHGLRKAAARRLAEAGCSANEIKSVTGHKTLKEVERYTIRAAQRGLAESAMDRVTLADQRKSDAHSTNDLQPPGKA